MGPPYKVCPDQGQPSRGARRDTVQIEGVAEILGSPQDERNKRYADILRKKYPESQARFADEPGMVIVKVVPTSVAVFDQSDGQLCLKCLDLENETAHLRWLTG